MVMVREKVYKLRATGVGSAGLRKSSTELFLR